jgi:hypothetical protein
MFWISYLDDDIQNEESWKFTDQSLVEKLLLHYMLLLKYKKDEGLLLLLMLSML